MLRYKTKLDLVIQSPCTSSGQETERVYSYNPGARRGLWSTTGPVKHRDQNRCIFRSCQNCSGPTVEWRISEFQTVGQAVAKARMQAVLQGPC